MVNQYLFHCSLLSTLGRLTFGLAHSLLWGGCPVHCRKPNSILVLYIVDASSNLPVVTTQMSFDIAKCSLGTKVVWG